MMQMKPLGYFDWIVLIFCSGIGLFHVTGIFISMDISPWWRHLLFGGICFFIGYAWLKRLIILPYFIGALFLQQCTTHGVSIVKTFQNERVFDWKSILILLLLLILLIKSILSHRLNRNRKPLAI